MLALKIDFKKYVVGENLFNIILTKITIAAPCKGKYPTHLKKKRIYVTWTDVINKKFCSELCE